MSDNVDLAVLTLMLSFFSLL